MGKTLIRLIKEKRESIGLTTNELATLSGIGGDSPICIESEQQAIKPVMEEAIITRLKISNKEWAEVKQATLELKELLHYQKAFIQLRYRSKGTDAIKCLTAEEYEVIKEYSQKKSFWIY